MSDDVILQTVPLGLHWPTIDPFLFCAHHDDTYPVGNEQLGPDASLNGRNLGMDFEGIDGWRMYHGTVVPGFPQHPHRGFETITYVRDGMCDHSDSLGATARFGEGDVQWLTAGSGIVHSEMMPLRNRSLPNPLELFQIWLNLPATNKMCEPQFSMLWSDQIPKIRSTDDQGRSTEIVVIAGSWADTDPLPPPPHSWASETDSDVAVWHLHLDPGSALALPPAASEATIRTLYVFDGDGVQIGDTHLGQATGSVLKSTLPTTLHSASGADCLILQGRPIGEPVAQQGPFVMNDDAGLRQAFVDYQRTGFGGWPWPTDGPVHERDRGRFAIHPDGRLEEPSSAHMR
ncbi:MAG: pirin family protein [Actinomycetes bacterium]